MEKVNVQAALNQKLMALDGHEGARPVIQAHPDETVGVPFPEGVFDIDTAADYARLTAVSGNALVLLRD